jgi:predicted  nucleic acid-binding Zn-ribbon protein
MREQLQRRLDALKKEFSAGKARATELEQQQTTLHQTLLRISGAIQVLEEELKDAQDKDGAPLGDAAQADPGRVNGSLDRVAT